MERMLAEASTMVIVKVALELHRWFEAHTGIYHLAGKGYASMYYWVKAVAHLDPNKDLHMVREIQSAKSNEFPTLSRLPEYSALAYEHFEETFGIVLPDWMNALALAMDEAP